MTAVLAIVAALCLSTLLQPATAIAGAFCMMGLEQWAQASTPFFVTRGGRALINYIIGSIVLLGLARKFVGGYPILRGYPAVGFLVVTLFSYALVSTFWAPNPARSLSVFIERAPYIVTIVFLCPLLCSRTEDFEWMLNATFMLGTLVAFLLMFTVEWDGRKVAFPSSIVEYSGNALVPGSLGGTIAIIAAFLSWHRLKFLNIFKWLVVVLGLLLVVKSGSRGQTLAVIVAICACWPIAHRLGNFKAYVGFGSAIVCLIAAASWGLDLYWADSERWGDDAIDEATGTRFRFGARLLEHWYVTPATIFFGLGSSASSDLIGTYSHVVPVDILTEEGILGFLIYAAIVLTCFKKGLFVVRYNRVQRTQLAILCALFIFYFVVSLKQGNMLGSPLLFMAAVLVGKYEKAVQHAHRLAQVTERDRPVQAQPILDDRQTPQ